MNATPPPDGPNAARDTSAAADTLPLDLLRAEISRAYDHARDLPVTPVVDVGTMRALVAERLTLDSAMPLGEVFERCATLLREQSLHITHPRYFGLFNPSVHPSSILADALVALYNPQVAGWTHAPAANEMERHVLERLAVAIGFAPGETTAHFTSGGGEANHTAILAALASRYPEWSTGGIRSLPRRPIIYVSREGHHSFTKVARAVGLGTDALRSIEVDDRLRMRVDALEAAVAHDREHHDTPFLIVGTAGTTGAGAIDPLHELATIAEREGLWFHVDAAWGGSAALAPSLRHHLAGAERADSLTWDAHKWLSIPLGAGMLISRHGWAVERAFSVDTGYIPPTAHGATDLYKSSMQWSRRFMGLKLIFALAEHGVAGIGEFIEHQARMGALIRERLVVEGWRVMNDSPFPLVCFTHDSLGQSEHQTKRFIARILERQRVWISDVRLPHHGWALRACVTSFRTDEHDVEVLMDELRTVLAGD